MTDPRQTHTRDQREARAVDAAHEAAAFYKALRTQKIPAGAATAMAEAYVTAMRGEEPPEPWMP